MANNLDQKFFAIPDIWTNIQSYFKAKGIQTQDTITSDLNVKTKDSFWFYSQLSYTWSWYEKNIAKTNMDRRRRYEELQLMDQDAEINAALNIYADEATTISMSSGHVVNIVSENEKVKEEIEKLFYKTLQIEEQIWGLTRDLCKYGDAPFEIVLNSEEDTITRLVPIPVEGFERIEADKSLQEFLYKPVELYTDAITASNSEAIEAIHYKPFEVAHFSIKTNDQRYAPYGMPVIEPARKVWKQLKILEDCLLINRLTRSQERKVFYVDVGNMDPANANNFIGEIKREFTKKGFYNASTGEIDMQASPINQMQDFFIPIRAGASNSRIDALTPSSNFDQTGDVNIFRDKMLAALGIPPAYLGRVSGIGATGQPTTTVSGLSQQDKKFGRKIQRIQKSVVSTLYKIAYIQLFLKGFSTEDIESLEINLTYPSDLDQQIQLEALDKRLATATSAKGVMGSNGTNLFSDYWIYKNIMKFTDEEIEEIIKQRIDETPAAGGPNEGGMTSGGGAAPAGGIEGEFQEFAGEPGETPPEEGAAPAEGGTPEAGKEAAPEAKAPEVAHTNRKGSLVLESLKNTLKFVQNKRKTNYDTKYKLNNFSYLVSEGELRGLADADKVSALKKKLIQ